MAKIIKAGFAYSIVLLLLVIPICIIGFIVCKELILVGVMFLIAGIVLFKQTYCYLLVINRKSERWCKTTLSNEELEIVEDAKELIRSVDNQIVISSFNVYKVRFVAHGWFHYDKDTHELCIFIPFKLLLRLESKDLCFVVVLHEILHSQNLKNNLNIFNIEFLEGLNQLLTNWLIDNYSKKYKSKKIRFISLKLSKNSSLCISLRNTQMYERKVNMVNSILQEANIDLKQVFLKYIDFQPEYFKSFVPSKFFKHQ